MFNHLMFGDSSPMNRMGLGCKDEVYDLMTPGKDFNSINCNGWSGKHSIDGEEEQQVPLRDESPSSSVSSLVSQSILHLGKQHTFPLTPSPISSSMVGRSPQMPHSSSSALMALQTPQVNDPKRLLMHPTIDIQVINQKLETVKEEIRQEVEKRLEQMKIEYQNELHSIRDQFLRNEQELERERFEKMELQSKIEALEQQIKVLTSDRERATCVNSQSHTRHDMECLQDTPLIPIQSQLDTDSEKENHHCGNAPETVLGKHTSKGCTNRQNDDKKATSSNSLHSDPTTIISKQPDKIPSKVSTQYSNVDISVSEPIGPRIRAQDITSPQQTFSCNIIAANFEERSQSPSQQFEEKTSTAPQQQPPSNKLKEFKEVKGVYQYTAILQNFHLRKGEEHVPKKKKSTSNVSSKKEQGSSKKSSPQTPTPQLSLKERVASWHANEREKEEKFYKQKELLDIYFSSKMKGTPACERLKNIVIHTTDMWNNLFISYNDRERFLDEHVLRPISLSGKKHDQSRWILTDEYISSMLSAFLDEYNRLASYFQQNGSIFKSISEREGLKSRISYLWRQQEAGAVVTKEYVELGTRLKKLNHELMKTLNDYEKANNCPFMFQGFRYLDVIHYDQLVQQEEIEEMEKKALQHRIKRSIQ